MFKLNRLTKTKKGDKVTPYLIQDGVVFAFDSDKNAVTLQLSDFEVNTPKKRKPRQPVIMVKGTAPTPIDENISKKAFNLNESAGFGGIYEERPFAIKPPTTITKPESDPVIPEEFIISSDENIEFESSTVKSIPIPECKSDDYEEKLERRDYEVKENIVTLKSSGTSPSYLLAVEEAISSIDADDFYGGL